MPITVQETKHDAIDPDPRNPRQICDEAQLLELANDVGVRGILQPIVVRVHPDKKGRLMIVFGERRWRAAGMVGLKTVPVIVREYAGDLAVLEDQIAENGKRSDVHPIEEADAYRRLHEEHGREVEEIADLCGKSRAYVYAQMKLCVLAPEPRRAFLAGKFDKSIALLIARLPAAQQAQATKDVLENGDHYDGDGTMSYREAKDHIRETFMLRLADAPFKIDDATLAHKAGPCTVCPKRTGNQRELFDDVVTEKGGLDVCTDPACYKQKVDVHWARLAVVAKEKGREVLEGPAADRAGSYGDKLVKLDDRCSDDPKNRTYRELLGKRADDAVAAIARDRNGEVKELVAKSNLPKLFKEAGVTVRKESNGRSQSDYEREAKEQRELSTTVTRRAREAVLGKLDDAADGVLWQLLARVAVRVARSDAQRELMKLHEVTVKSEGRGTSSYGQRSALLDFVDKLPVRAAREFAVELLLAEAGDWRDSDETSEGMTPAELAAEKEDRREYATGLEHAADLFKIDLDAIAKKSREDLKKIAEQKQAKKKEPASTGVKVPNVTTLISMTTSELQEFYAKVFGKPTKRDREWVMQRLNKLHNEQNGAPEASA